jgi:hypothetical protein
MYINWYLQDIDCSDSLSLSSKFTFVDRFLSKHQSRQKAKL